MADGSAPEGSRLRYEAGETIFRQGEASEAAYLVESGAVGIYRRYADFSLKLGVITAGQMFGEMACIDGSPRGATAVCQSAAELVVLPRPTLEQKLAETDPLVHKALLTFIRYIRRNHESYARLMQAIETIRMLQSAPDLDAALAAMPELLARLFADCAGRMKLTNLDGRKAEVIVWGAGGVDDPPGFSVPLKDGRDHLGTLQLNRHPPEDLNGEQFVTTMAEHIGLTLGNLRLRQRLAYMASRDGLTGLYNRGYAEEWLAKEIKLSARRGSPLAIILMDLDFFKDINDSWGHQAGDDVLRAIGGLLTETQRAGDMVSRYGGEEFLLGLVDCSLLDAIKKAERIRRQIEAMTVETGGNSLDAITASFGVAVFPDFGDSYLAVTKAADDALYRAKEWGRNRVESATHKAVGW